MADRLSAWGVIVIGGAPRNGVGHPAIDVGFPPSRAVDADPELGRECAFGDLAVDRGPGEARAGANGLHTDDAVWCGHGSVASCCWFLDAPDPVRPSIYERARGFFASSCCSVQSA